MRAPSRELKHGYLDYWSPVMYYPDSTSPDTRTEPVIGTAALDQGRSMLRMSKLTDYGLVLLTHMAQRSVEEVRTAHELAETSKVPLPTVSKILKELSRAGIVISHRGRRGGYTLARSPAQISVASVVEA